ncbi:hypothetical protein BWZ20_02355 [Winogradskyella sp. J14-2]|uniref:hypothetical protein n=1 Tax=Winogradskyella sp. J14-2 TaxID=1936080 RepID=UPI000972DE48|nr:hypothetical protein [Winogradskyella sp. J14-2]APY07215.1 hypothetical protein BWZ20_02355 [Winogradskyella sp. J14-2]
MKHIVLLSFALLLGFSSSAQGRRDRMGNPIINREPTEEEIAKYEQKLEERKDQYIENFLATLEADAFQKEIIKQYLNSYFEAKTEVLKIKYERIFDREQAIKKLDESHFKDLEELISEDDMTKIKDMIKGDFDEKEVKKKKKKKRKKKKND